jgi:predicted MFS family arabinose efflux permease
VQQRNEDKKSPVGRLFVPSLTLTCFSLFIVDIIATVFLPDLSMTFFGSTEPVFIAITSQLVTVANVVAAAFGLLLGVLSIRFSHKKLLVLGVICIPVGALGCFLAPNFISMQIFFSIEGIGTMVVWVMQAVLVGELLALNKRPQAIGWISTGAVFANMAGTLVISFFFADTGSWRTFLLWFALPISLIALAASYFGVPQSTQKPIETVGKEDYVRSFKQVFLQKSAAGCLIGNVVRTASMMWGIYILAFFRMEFGLSIASGALVGFGLAPALALGQIIGGYLVNRVGRKRLTVISLLIHGAALPLIVFVPDLWVALAILYLGSFIGALAMSAIMNLTLEQVPEFRGTMMSINNVLTNFGTAMGVAIGGVALALFDYTGVFLIFAVLILIAAAIFLFLTKDPCANAT